MSGIVLSASVRQNLLSLQSTASLLATTQNDLATGNKVNSALDNPTNFFTAQVAQQPRQRHQQPARRHRQRRAGPAGRQHRHHLAAEPGLQRPVDRQPGAAEPGRLFDQVQRDLGRHHRRHGQQPARYRAPPTTTVTGTAVTNDADARAVAITATTQLVGTASYHVQRSRPRRITNGSTLTVDGKTITFRTAQTTSSTDGSRQRHDRHRHRQHADGAATCLTAIDSITGASARPRSVSGGTARAEHRHDPEPGYRRRHGQRAHRARSRRPAPPAVTPPALSGETLTRSPRPAAARRPASPSVPVPDQVSTLNAAQYGAGGEQPAGQHRSSTGAITITTTNNAASSTIGTISGTAAATRRGFQRLDAAAAPVADPNSQATRASLVAQYNNVLAQINTTAQDCVLQRRQPVERRHAEADVQRNRQVDAEHHRRHLQRRRPRSVDADRGHRLPRQQLGQQGVDRAEQTPRTTLRTEASALGSNLSIVQIRQDFNKNLINVLQTGSSNLTLADTNEEAANSQALSTRQSIAVSALALANQSQQSVLQLLR